jgi:general L-amino acid transport system substrate-binding protein
MSANLLAPLLIAAVLLGGQTASAAVLDTVKSRGAVVCGVTSGTPGFSANNVNGKWTGLGADYCRALAAAIFNDPEKVQFTPLADADRLTALTSGKVDVLTELSPWTLAADTGQGVVFVGTMFYDGQSFMVPKASGIKSARDLAGKSVCVEGGTDGLAQATDYFDASNIDAKVLELSGRDDAAANYTVGKCIAYSADASVLAGVRATLATPTDHIILPDIISKDPLSIAINQGDDRWFDVARWTFFGLLDAEELGVAQNNVDEMLGSDNISIRRLLGVEGDFGAEIGLNKDWAYQLIKGVGNYADIYDRNVGDQTPLKLPRGLNALWNKGGIQYSPPVR